MDVDIIVKPLMDFLEDSLHRYNQLCEKVVFERILRELWKTTILSIETFVVFPTSNEKSFLRHIVSRDQIKEMTNIIIYSREVKDIKYGLKDMIGNVYDRIIKTLTIKQSQILDSALNVVQEAFHANGYGLSQTFMDNSTEFLSLKYALTQYSLSSKKIIQEFILNQKEQYSTEASSIGILNTQVDLDTRHKTGRINVKIISAKHLQLLTQGSQTIIKKLSNIKICVEIYLAGPLSPTSYKNNHRQCKTIIINNYFKFDETFNFLLTPEEKYENYELIFHVKESSLIYNKIIGVGALKLSNVLKLGTISPRIPLFHQLYFDEKNLVLLRILSQRQKDEVAKEFVNLLTTHATH